MLYDYVSEKMQKFGAIVENAAKQYPTQSALDILQYAFGCVS